MSGIVTLVNAKVENAIPITANVTFFDDFFGILSIPFNCFF